MNIQSYQALSQGGRDWTDAFRAAIGDLRAAGGGLLTVPAGTYPTRSIQLYSDITLEVQAGAILSFLDTPEDYELIGTEFEGIPESAYMPMIFAEDAQNVTLRGEGTLNGNGRLWWQRFKAGSLPNARPYLVCFQRCERVVIEGVRLTNSPVWTVHPLYCSNVAVRGISIINPADSPNTDGINPNGCSHVRISDCYIDVGDDCIAIKSGTEDTPSQRPCENIVISGCTMAHGHGGVVIGSEMSGGVRNLVVTGCVFQHTDRGIRIKTRRKRGGTVENLLFSNILMDDVACPFVLNMHYFCGKGGKEKHVWDRAPYPVDGTTPALRDIRIHQVTVTSATACAGFAVGLAEQPLERISLSDVTVTMRAGHPAVPAMLDGIDEMEAAGFYLRNARDVSLQNVRIVGQLGETLDVDESVTFEQKA